MVCDKALEQQYQRMEEKKRSLKLVIRLPSKEKKAGIEVKVQKEAESFGSSSPDPIGSAENMGKLQNDSKDCDKGSRSSRFCIKIPLKLKKVSQETNNDQELQPRIEKVPDRTRDDPEVQEIIENTENQDEGKKMGALNGELSKNFRSDEAEEKEKRKRKCGFTLALSEEQIEEDILGLLGPKSASKRRGKKGHRASQHPLNHLFPGGWMENLIDH